MKIARGQKGFTLIEMAIVLIIIGIIIGAVVKGKDLIQSGKQKKFYTKFLREWELAVINYYDRTGRLLGDGTANGGRFNPPNGRFDQIYSAAHFNNINTRLEQVGLTPPAVTSAGNNHTFRYNGKFVSSNVQMRLYWQDIGGPDYNVLRLENIPTDLAMALDMMIDGEANGSTGSFRRLDSIGDWPVDASNPNTVDAAYILDVP